MTAALALVAELVAASEWFVELSAMALQLPSQRRFLFRAPQDSVAERLE